MLFINIKVIIVPILLLIFFFFFFSFNHCDSIYQERSILYLTFTLILVLLLLYNPIINN